MRMGEMGKCFCPPLRLVGGAGGRVLLADIQQFRLWLQQSRPGDHMIYARGTWLGGVADAAPLAAAVRAAAEDTLLRCHQRRLPCPPEGPGGYDYIAWRTPAPLGAGRRRAAHYFPTRAAAERASAASASAPE